MKRLIFYNNRHNGDIHLTREFVKDIMKKTSFDEYYFLHKQDPKLLMDIPNLRYGHSNENCFEESPFHVVNNETYINTHMNVYEIFVDFVKDVSLDVFYDYFQIIFNRLRISMEKKRFYIPSINYEVYEINGIKEYIAANKKPTKVLVCNGNIYSKQSMPVDFKLLIETLSTDYPDIHFILTEKNGIEKPNVFYTNDIIKCTTGDLNEISYLSTHCATIIGRSSGPSTYCIVKDNVNDVDKTIISICNLFTDAFWHDKTLCNKVWINNYDYDNIYNTIKNELSRLNNYNNIISVASQDNRIVMTTSEDIPQKIRVDFLKGKDMLYTYDGQFTKDIFHWIIPHGHYHTGMEVKCKFYFDETNQYLFQKIV